MYRTLIVTFCIAGLAEAADRPTAEQVKKSVEESRAQYVKENPPPTQAEAVKELEDLLKRQKSELTAAMKNASGANRTTKFKKLFDEIDETKRKLAQTKRKYEPKPTKPRLLDFKSKNAVPGNVGHVDSKSLLHCERVFDSTSFLGYISRAVPKEQIVKGTAASAPPKAEKSSQLLFANFDTSGLRNGKSLQKELDLVVTGEFTYEDVLGNSVMVPVVEPFDPNKPFK